MAEYKNALEYIQSKKFADFHKKVKSEKKANIAKKMLSIAKENHKRKGDKRMKFIHEVK